MGFGAPVAQEVNVSPNQGLQTLSSLIGLKQQAQTLQTGQALQASAKAEATTRGIAAQGQSEAADFLKNFDFAQHIGPDGTLDMNAALSNPKFQNAGPGKELIANALLGIKNNQIKNKQDMAQLNNTVIDTGSRLLGSLADDEDVKAGNDKGLEKINSQIGIVNDMFPDQGAAFTSKFQNVLNSGHIKPEDRAAAVRAFQLQAADVLGQKNQQNPVLGSQVGPNGQLTGTAQDRVTGALHPAAGGVPLGLSPAQLAQTITLPNNQVTTLGQFLHGGGTGAKAPPTNQSPFLGKNGLPRTAQDDAPPPNAPGQVQQQFGQSVKATSDYVDQVRSADEQYGTNVAVSTAIRNLLKGGVSTGPGTQKWHDVLGAMGAPADLNNVADYQQLGAWLERQSAGMRPTLGLPNTNAGQTASETTSGTTSYQPAALEAKNNFNQALIEGLHQQRQGLDKVAGYSGNPSPSAVGSYRAAWANNFDPIVHEYKAAKMRGDSEAVKQILSKLSPQEAAQLVKKGRNLDLLEKGQEPQ